MTYHVVFEFGEEVKSFGVSLSGIRTSQAFESKENFEEYYTQDKQKKLKVIAQGISSEEVDNLLSIHSLEKFLTDNVAKDFKNQNI